MEATVEVDGNDLDLAEKIQKRAKTPMNVSRIIWYEFNGGVGPWGAIRTLNAILLALIPFLAIVAISPFPAAKAVRQIGLRRPRSFR